MRVDIRELLNAFTQMGATWVLWLLVGLSIAGIAVVLERTAFLLWSRDDVGKLQRELRKMLALGDLARARRSLEESPSFEARVAAAGLGAGSAAGAEARMAGETEIVRQAMEKNLIYLGTLGNNAPFVGLLGTVIGIIGAFHQLNQGVGQVTAGLMTQIGEALVATAIGLLVALPAVAFYNLFQRIIKLRLGRASVLGSEVMAYFKSVSAEAAG
jgi:biopolymer transport protein ExbB